MSAKDYTVIGTRPVRPDAVDKVTGRARFGADFRLPGLLEGFVLRSPHAHARILRIDTSKAEALPGVHAVVTAADLPEPADRVIDFGEGPMPLESIRGNVLARGKALYKGHAVAAVAAVNRHVAEEAASLIEVEYEVLPSVTTVEDAMRDGAPALHEGKPGNVTDHFQFSLGDIEKGFAEADLVIEREFHTSTVHQGYLEPQTATAMWNHDGRIEIWTSTQGAFAARDATAWVLGLPESRVTVTPMEVGGAFGGKIRVYLEPAAALLSKKSGRPVRVTMARRDVFEATGPTPGSCIRVKIGVRRDGRITAAQAYMAYEAGAFPGSMVAFAALCIFAPYDIPNLAIDGYDVVVNKPSTAPYRAPGATNAAFASESVVDELAEKLKLDPIDFRLMNAAKEGTRRADGPKYPRIGCVEVLEAMKRHPHYGAALVGPNRGLGVALGFWFNAGGPSCATLAVNTDGSVSLLEGSVDLAGTRTSLAMQAAEALGLSTADVQASVANTGAIGYTGVTGGSRTTFATGWAVYEAAQDIIRQMKARAAILWETGEEQVAFERGVFRSGDRALSFKELAARLGETGGPVIGRGAVNPGGVGGSFAGAIADVTVDPETGRVTILRFISVQDVGTAVHPGYVEGQMQGGSAQGIGWALNEEYWMSPEGNMMNSTLLDYRMPVSMDLPMIDTVMVEVPNPGHPFGVRGVGEANIVPPPAALANAIYRAAGVRMDRLPMNPPAMMEAIWRQRD